MRTAEPFDMLPGRHTSFPPRTEVCIYHFKQINLMGWTLDECFSSFLEIHLTPGPIYIILKQIFMKESSCYFPPLEYNLYFYFIFIIFSLSLL